MKVWPRLKRPKFKLRLCAPLKRRRIISFSKSIYSEFRRTRSIDGEIRWRLTDPGSSVVIKYWERCGTGFVKRPLLGSRNSLLRLNNIKEMKNQPSI